MRSVYSLLYIIITLLIAKYCGPSFAADANANALQALPILLKNLQC